MSTLAVNTITNAAGGDTAQINGMTPTGLSLQGFRNRLFNGNMVIDQRNNGASVTYPGGGNAGVNLYVLDRFVCNSTGSTRFSIQRSTTAPQGFTNSALITTTTAGSPGASDACYFGQYIEGFNVADLGFGTAAAQAVTLSFWVRSSLTGLFGGTLANTDFSRRYAWSFTINAANTWEYKTITIPGDTTGTWATTDGRGFSLLFNLGSGSLSKGTGGAWGSSVTYPSGTVDLVATAGATLNITGVQLEAGAVATPFERRPFGTELALCQRYAFVPRASTLFHSFGVSSVNGTTPVANISFPVTMRVVPTLAAASAGSTFLFGSGSAPTISLDQTSETNTWIFGSGGSGGTAGFSGRFLANNTTSAFLSFSAEL